MNTHKESRKDKKYQIIYADPPWNYSSTIANGNKRNKIVNLKRVKISDNYSVMSTCDIRNLPIQRITGKDCALFIWTTDAFLEDCIKVIKDWGFKYKTVAFNWIKKEKSGIQTCYMAPWTLKSSELCLLATKGSMNKFKVKNNVRQLVEAVRGKHSEKPNEVRERIVELFGDLPRIELFARQKTEGWDVWGNEVESDIDLLT